MKKNLEIPFKNWRGEPIYVKASGENGDEVLKPQLVSDELGALFFNVSGSDKIQVSGDEKLRLYRLACQIAKTPNEVDMSAEDIVLIKRLLEPTCSAGAYGQLVEILEG